MNAALAISMHTLSTESRVAAGGPGGQGPRVILICIVLSLIVLLFLRRCA